MVKLSCLSTIPGRVVAAATPIRKQNGNAFGVAAKAAARPTNRIRLVASHRARAIVHPARATGGRRIVPRATARQGTALKRVVSGMPLLHARATAHQHREIARQHQPIAQAVLARIRVAITLTGEVRVTPIRTQIQPTEVAVVITLTGGAILPIGVARVTMPTGAGAAVVKRPRRQMFKSLSSRRTPGCGAIPPTEVPTVGATAGVSAKKTVVC